MKKINSKNTFLNIWKDIENKSPRPLLARKLIIVDYKSFSKKVFNGNLAIKKKLAKSLYGGDIYLLKKAFPKKQSSLLSEDNIIED